VSGEPAAGDTANGAQGSGGGDSSSQGDPAAGPHEAQTQRSVPRGLADHGPEAAAQPSEQELREAYEAELSRITAAEMVLQAAVSLLNIGGYRLGLAGGPGADAGPERDLDQVRDAIDGARGLMPVLERSMPAGELGPLRDALARLQLAYAREAGAVGQAPPPPGAGKHPSEAGAGEGAAPAGAGNQAGTESEERPKGPAESSGRLWVPGR
jgi:hypothetical protein